MRIALTNDDGIFAVGLRALYKALQERGHSVDVVAPMTEQSGVGRSVTVHTPLRIKEIQERDFKGTGVFGTPTDCVKLGLCELLPDTPDVFLSGINIGPNVGPDILYSGTVSAAAEAASHGVPALAVSYGSHRQADMTEQARYAVKVMETIPWEGIPERRVMNLNLPALPTNDYKGLKVCPASDAVWKDWYHKHEDHRSRPYWWLDGTIPSESAGEGSDKALLDQGWATLTPLRFSFTDDGLLSALEEKMR